MGSSAVFIFLVLAVSFSEARIRVPGLGARCPPPNWVRGGTPCREDYDCRYNLCCPNSFGTKNCIDTVSGVSNFITLVTLRDVQGKLKGMKEYNLYSYEYDNRDTENAVYGY